MKRLLLFAYIGLLGIQLYAMQEQDLEASAVNYELSAIQRMQDDQETIKNICNKAQWLNAILSVPTFFWAKMNGSLDCTISSSILTWSAVICIEAYLRKRSLGKWKEEHPAIARINKGIVEDAERLSTAGLGLGVGTLLLNGILYYVPHCIL